MNTQFPSSPGIGVIGSAAPTGSAVNSIVNAARPQGRRKPQSLQQYLNNNAKFNVLDYGAIGNGVADDSAAVLDAIADAEMVGGEVVLPGGTYRMTQPIILRHASLVGPTGPAVQNFCAILRRDFSGDFVVIDGSAGLQNILIDDASVGANRAGAALKFYYHIDGGGVERRAGYNKILNVRVTSYDVTTGAWQRIVDIDGTADASPFGVRDVSFISCWFFGARSVDDTIRIRKGVHIQFLAFAHVPAPLTVRQGISVDAASEDIFFANADVIGTLTSYGRNVVYTGGKIGNDAGSASISIKVEAVNNIIHTSLATGTVSNLSVSSSVVTVGAAGAIHHVRPSGGTMKIFNGDSNLGLSSNPGVVQVESLNGYPMDLKANGIRGIQIDNGKLGFFTTPAVTKPAITGSRGGNAALASLLTAGATLGLWTDNTTA